MVDLARFARNAGFGRDDVPIAAGLAYATTGGADHYDFVAGAPGVGHYVGLWGVDVDEHRRYRSHDMHDPRVAAAVAFELHQAAGDFEWCPAFAAGAHRPYVAHAAIEASREHAITDVPRVGLTLTLGRRVGEYADQLHNARASRDAIRSEWEH